VLALGLDIGGANLKAASSAGEAKTTPFEIWRAPRANCHPRFARADRWLPRGADVLAVTMTAELADCFATKGRRGRPRLSMPWRGRRAGTTPVFFLADDREFRTS